MIYLDNAATTRPLADALETCHLYHTDCYFNASALYKTGRDVFTAIGAAKKTLLSAFATQKHDVIFTSGGSESDNTAIFSAARRGNAVTTVGEHSAVYESFRQLQQREIETRFAPIDKNGKCVVDDLLALVDENTTLVSVVHVNNETGALNDVNAIAAAVKRKNPRTVVHVDGVQAFGKIPYRLSADVDFYAVSAHKIGGIKGTGALFYKKTTPLHPLIFGGGQEGGLRSGTENVFGIKVMEYAAKHRLSAINKNFEHAKTLANTVISLLDKDVFAVISSPEGSPYVVSLSAVGVRGEVLQHMMENLGVIVGTGSACSSRSRHSRILTACGYRADVLDGAIRLSFCPETTVEEVATAVSKLNDCAKKLKKVMNV